MKKLIITAFFLISIYTVYSQKIDTVYNIDGKIEGYGSIKEGKRIGTWNFLINKNNKSYQTITYLENNKGVVKY